MLHCEAERARASKKALREQSRGVTFCRRGGVGALGAADCEALSAAAVPCSLCSQFANANSADSVLSDNAVKILSIAHC